VGSISRINFPCKRQPFFHREPWCRQEARRGPPCGRTACSRPPTRRPSRPCWPGCRPTRAPWRSGSTASGSGWPSRSSTPCSAASPPHTWYPPPWVVSPPGCQAPPAQHRLRTPGTPPPPARGWPSRSSISGSAASHPHTWYPPPPRGSVGPPGG